jgi:hypothetical protein
MEAQEIRISKPVSKWSLCPDVVFKGNWFSPTSDRMHTLNYELDLIRQGWRITEINEKDGRRVSTWRPRRSA